MTRRTQAGRGSHYATADLDNAVKKVLPIHVRTKKCPGAATSLFQLRQLARRAVQRSPGSIVTLADPPVPDGPNQRLSNCMVRRARRPAAMCDTFVTDCTFYNVQSVRSGRPKRNTKDEGNFNGPCHKYFKLFLRFFSLVFGAMSTDMYHHFVIF